ncbi:outer membrane protein assembly factor BamE [Sphingosinicella sp. CPCC 101087]|uniref:outer membrane protein assembly factor BamE domain-containing protein n=1 Tax=Sphingosinicella sp. CPCC 101087 TaxID=2497754 RepID=UPI00197E6219|nr:outer membrane protein assembly factor BamE [Sphingosinicella sp. CPCC 101087]
MKLKTLITTPLLAAILLAPAAAQAEEEGASAPDRSASSTAEAGVATGTAYVGRVDPAAFRESPRIRDKSGVTVSPDMVRLIVPGVDKFSIYPLIGPPHFQEWITRRWNYILNFPVAPGSAEMVRCRMEIRFGPPGPGRYHVRVSEVVWQEQACADRVAQAS